MKQKILLTGADGLVGSRFVELFSDKYDLLTPHYTELDITSKNAVSKFGENNDFDFLIHLAAYTNVDKAETEPELVKKLNVDGTKNIFELAKAKNARLIHISTDFVFDGESAPYDENSIPNPKGVYGTTKYEAEKIVSNFATIVRICFPYRKFFEPKKDFVRTLAGLLKSATTLKMVTDATITPTLIDDIAYGLEKTLQLPNIKVVHLVGSKSYSPFEAAVLIAKKIGADIDLVQKTTFAEFYAGKAPRPQFSSMITIENDFWEMKSLEEGLDEIF